MTLVCMTTSINKKDIFLATFMFALFFASFDCLNKIFNTIDDFWFRLSNIAKIN